MVAATILEYAFRKSFFGLKKPKKTGITEFSAKNLKYFQSKNAYNFNLYKFDAAI
jgi:hypothetical protein